jgi:nudix-type nucleoside diphosphatase (YffH/AdpP family)
MFLIGPLADPAVLSVVLGRRADVFPAQLHGFQSVWAPGHRLAGLCQDGAATATGRVVTGLKGDDLDRLEYFCTDAQGQKREVTVTLAERTRTVPLICAAPTQDAQIWPPTDWDALWRVIMVHAAREFMDGFGTVPAKVAAGRFPVMAMRGAAFQRASSGQVPATVRSDMGRDRVEVINSRRPYSNFFTVEEQDLRFPRFDGTLSVPVTRATFVDGDAITVLPYDPARDRVMLVEQFRLGPFVRGEPRPWMLEAVAGRIDAGETPEAAARRELVEETSISAGKLIKVASYYPSSGAVTGYFFSFVAICDLPDHVAGVSGLESEAEDIRSHLVDFDHAMALVESGEAEAGPLILTLFWLENRRAQLGEDA